MSENCQQNFTVVFLGTYDLSKPRTRILMEGAKTAGINIMQCNADVWQSIPDKSQIKGISYIIKLVVRLVTTYPLIMLRYLRLPSHDAVVIGYLGLIDLLVLWPVIKLRKVPVFWDMFISLYDTMVDDRKMFSKRSPVAWLLFATEWLATRIATKVFLDTATHARFIEQLFNLPTRSAGHVLVGAEPIFHHPPQIKEPNSTFTALFYGQFIPLHGVDVIIEAAYLLEQWNEKVHWVIVGRGQESDRIDRIIRERNIRSIERIEWVAYESLPALIARADVGLGIFGTSKKSHNVIPNKVYQVLAANGRIVTANTPAMHELYGDDDNIVLVEPGNPRQLAEAIMALKRARRAGISKIDKVGPREVGQQFQVLLESVLGCRRRCKNKERRRQ